MTSSTTVDACVTRGPAAVRLVVLSAVGTATRADGKGVIVFVGPTPNGSDVPVVLSSSDCAVLETVALSP